MIVRGGYMVCLSKTDGVPVALLAWIVAMPIAIYFRNEPFTLWALSTVILLQLHSKANWKAWLASILLAIPAILIGGLTSTASIICGIAIGCTCVGTFRWVRRQTDWLHALLPMAITYITIGVGLIHLIVRCYTPHTIDSAILGFEKRWIFSLSVTVWQWCEAHRFVYLFFFVIYKCLPCVAILVVASAGKAGCARVMKPLLLCGLAAVPFYLLFPAVGPAHVADSFHAVRNCIPSLHLTWAMLCG